MMVSSPYSRVLKKIPMQRLAVSMYKRTIIPSYTGIKKDTRAVIDSSGIWLWRACKCRIIFVTCQSKLLP